MKARELIAILQTVDPDSPVRYKNPNFTGAHHEEFPCREIEVENGEVLIPFPFEEPCE